MLRDRFKDWGLDPKYNRHKPHKKRRCKAVKSSSAAEKNALLEEHTGVQQDAPNLVAIDSNPDDLLVSLVQQWPAYTVQTPNLATGSAIDSPMDVTTGYFADLPIRLSPNASSCIDHYYPQVACFDSTHVLYSHDAQSTYLLNPANPFFTPEPSRTPDTPVEEVHLQHTLSEIYRFLDRIVRNKSWLQAIEEPCYELQRLASDAHLAIASLTYDCRQVWRELGQLQSSAAALLPRFWKPCRNMHPRVLTILLRLLVDDCTRPLLETKTLEKVKNMFFFLAQDTLGSNHPVTLLCGTPTAKTKDLLWRQIELVKTRFYAKAKIDDPKFVACEQICSARVLASIGYPEKAEAELVSLIESLGCDADQYTLADAHRTLGFSQFHSAEIAEAQGNMPEARAKLIEAATESTLALELFTKADGGKTENVMYTHHRLACTFRKLGCLENCEEHFQAALNIWELNRKNHERQGGVKLVRDLDQVLLELGKVEASAQLRRGYPQYFEESPEDTP